MRTGKSPERIVRPLQGRCVWGSILSGGGVPLRWTCHRLLSGRPSACNPDRRLLRSRPSACNPYNRFLHGAQGDRNVRGNGDHQKLSAAGSIFSSTCCRLEFSPSQVKRMGSSSILACRWTRRFQTFWISLSVPAAYLMSESAPNLRRVYGHGFARLSRQGSSGHPYG